jgi:hypothetical protein
VVIKRLLLQAPAFAGEAFYTIPVYCMRETFGGYSKSCLSGIFTAVRVYPHKEYTVWKNRKRFSVPKKRFNEFSAF